MTIIPLQWKKKITSSTNENNYAQAAAPGGEDATLSNTHRPSILYLTLPFILFLFGWVRLTIAIPLSLILLFRIIKKGCET